MKLVLSLVVISALCALLNPALASSASGAATTCAINGGVGKYDYSPYSGKGPSHWSNLSKDYGACSNGRSQSPINFPNVVKYAKRSLTAPIPQITSGDFEFKPTPSNFEFKCLAPGRCGYSTFNGTRYAVVNVHFHAPSEHHMDGKSFPLEMHVVHQSKSGKLAVLATMFEYASESYGKRMYNNVPREFERNEFLDIVLNGMNEKTKKIVLPIGDVIRPQTGYCSYAGSLTTPPCSQGVTWMMALAHPTVTARQVHSFAVAAGASFDGNNRPVQKLNGRKVTCHIL